MTQGFLSLLLTWQVSDSDNLVPRDHLKGKRGSQSPSEPHCGHCHLQPRNTTPGWNGTPQKADTAHLLTPREAPSPSL